MPAALAAAAVRCCWQQPLPATILRLSSPLVAWVAASRPLARGSLGQGGTPAVGAQPDEIEQAAYCGLLRLIVAYCGYCTYRPGVCSCGEQAANADREGPQGRSGRGDSVRVAGAGIRSALRACGRAVMAGAQAPSTTRSVWSSQEPGP